MSGPGVLVSRGLGPLGSWLFGVLGLLLLLFLGFGALGLALSTGVFVSWGLRQTHMCGVVVLILTQVIWERTECMLGVWVGMKNISKELISDAQKMCNDVDLW